MCFDIEKFFLYTQNMKSYVLFADAGLSLREMEHFFPLLNDIGRGSGSRLRREDDRVLHCLSGLLLIYVLERENAPARRELRIARGDKGKPELVRRQPSDGGKGTCAEEQLHFSLSHSGRAVALAIADRPVGIDIERPGRYSEKLAKRFFHPQEQLRMREDEDPEKAFLRIWTMKEAYVKMLGTGFYTEPSSFSVFEEGISSMMRSCMCRDYQLSICSKESKAQEPPGLLDSAKLLEYLSSVSLE